MQKVPVFIFILIISNIQIGVCQKKIELKSYSNKDISLSDSLVFFAIDTHDSLEKNLVFN